MRRAVSLIVIKDNTILLVRGKDNITWTLPGGKPNGDETDLDCLAREIREEISVTSLGEISFYGEFTAPSPHKGDPVTVSCYFGNLYEDPTPSSEITACDWVGEFIGREISRITTAVIESLIRNKHLRRIVR